MTDRTKNILKELAAWCLLWLTPLAIMGWFYLGPSHPNTRALILCLAASCCVAACHIYPTQIDEKDA